jgi:hypothetical protein
MVQWRKEWSLEVKNLAANAEAKPFSKILLLQ